MLSSSNYAFLETDLRINESFAYHALAIDEHRESFRPTLWTRVAHPSAPDRDFPPRKLADVEQRWFVGADANVGGGYDSDLLAQPSLRWMLGRAASHGLAFRRDVVVDEGVSEAAIADSYGTFLGGWYRRIPRNPPFQRAVGLPPTSIGGGVERQTINETIDGTVFDRWRADRLYRPIGLEDWSRRLGIDPATITGAASAADGRAIANESVEPHAPANLA